MNEIIKKLTGLPVTALIFSLAFMGLVVFSYKIVYKTLFKGKKEIAFTKLLMASFLIGYIFILFFITIFRGEPSFSYATNFSLFSSYINAVQTLPDTANLWLLIFNIGMFLPIGFLLPFVSNRFNLPSITFMFALCATYIVEVIQYISGMGIFEVDDMFNNVLGAMIGFLISRIFLYKKPDTRTDTTVTTHSENLIT